MKIQRLFIILVLNTTKPKTNTVALKETLGYPKVAPLPSLRYGLKQ